MATAGADAAADAAGGAGPAGATAAWPAEAPAAADAAVGTTRAAPHAPPLPVRIIPCLDVRDGRVVKGVRFRGLADQGDPAELARAYEEQGADEVVVLDVTATPEARGTRLDTVAAVRARLSVPLTVGGGIGGVADAAALLEAGADKVAVNTAALRRPALLTELAARFGSQCVVASIDALGGGAGRGQEAARRGGRDDGGDAGDSGYQVVVLSGTERVARDAVAWAAEAADRGAGEILLTSIDRDGTRSGYELALLGAVRAVVGVPIVASGGADAPEHMADAVDAGADAVLAASIFHQGDWTVQALKRALAGLGVAVRPPHSGGGTGAGADAAGGAVRPAHSAELSRAADGAA